MTVASTSNSLPGKGRGPRARRALFGTFFGLAVSFLVLLAGVFLIDWRQTLLAFKDVNVVLVVATVLVFALSFPVFAVRWRRLLAVESPPSVMRLYRFLMIGYFANATLPGRPGDFIRLALLRRIKVRLAVGGASLLLERMLDVVVIASFGLILSFMITLPAAIAHGLQLVFAAIVVIIGFAVALSGREAWIRALPERYPTWLSGRVGTFVIEQAATFSSAIMLMRTPRQLAVATALTVVGWLPQVVGVAILLHAFHLPVPSAAALLVVVTTNLGAVIPSSPSNIGVYHGLAVLSLSVFGVEPEIALAFAICAHSAAIALHIALGITAALTEGIGLMRLRELQAEPVSDGSKDAQGAMTHSTPKPS